MINGAYGYQKQSRVKQHAPKIDAELEYYQKQMKSQDGNIITVNVTRVKQDCKKEVLVSSICVDKDEKLSATKKKMK